MVLLLKTYLYKSILCTEVSELRVLAIHARLTAPVGPLLCLAIITFHVFPDEVSAFSSPHFDNSHPFLGILHDIPHPARLNQTVRQHGR